VLSSVLPLLTLLVPHGGYVTSCFLRVAATHFAGTLSRQKQPQTMTLHLEFPRRTEVGVAKFIVKDVKLGRQTSTTHVSLVQHGKEEVVGYLTNSDLENEKGVTFPTEWELHPKPYTVDFSKLSMDEDANWAEQTSMPFAGFRKASSRVRFFFPREGQFLRSITDQWIRFRDGSRFTTESLGYVADMFPQIVEGFSADDDPYRVKPKGAEKGKSDDRVGAKYWYPTVVLNLDVKKALPKEGVEWLFCRASSKQIKKGRLDIEVVIMDESGDLVALSHHVALVLSAGRNLAARKREDGQSKI
jgi:acyl-CoA thioesterase